MPRHPQRLVVRRPAQVRALASPLAHRVASGLERIGPATVAELGAAIGEAPESLYYHVRRLHAAGILRPAGQRETGGRPEVVWEVPGGEIVFDHEGRDPRFRAALARAGESLMRMAARGYAGAVRRGDASRRGRGRTLMLQQHFTRLRPADLAELNRRLEEIAAFVRERDAGEKGTSVSLTMVMTPGDA
ncbi:MAG: helix-turn-helix transcriptional regulator [Phycisphaerales bacterium]|nr:helix-turn-helix transcriptional regulator [Phycisphaerales bacterium]